VIEGLTAQLTPFEDGGRRTTTAVQKDG